MSYVLAPFFYPWLVHDQLTILLAKELQIISGTWLLAVICDGCNDNEYCEINPNGSTSICSDCTAKKKDYISKICKAREIDVRYMVLSELHPEASSEYELCGKERLDIILSTLLKRHRVSSIKGLSLSPRLQENEILREYRFAERIHRCLASIVAIGLDISCAIVFNARFTPYRTTFVTCRRSSIDVLVHERGARDNSFKLYKNISCDDTSKQLSILGQESGTLSKGESDQLALYMDDRFHGRNTGYKPFLKPVEVRTSLDQSNNQDKETIILFTSSLDEKTARFREVNVEFYIGLAESLAKYARNNNLQMIIRHHPNLGAIGSPHGNTSFIDSFAGLLVEYPEIVVYSPESEICSYRLLEGAQFCVAPHSSLFLEGLYRKVPMFTTCHSPFQGLFECKYTLSSLDYGAGEPLLAGAEKCLLSSEYIRGCREKIDCDHEYIKRLCFDYFVDVSLDFDGIKIHDTFNADLETLLRPASNVREGLLRSLARSFASSREEYDVYTESRLKEPAPKDDEVYHY